MSTLADDLRAAILKVRDDAPIVVCHPDTEQVVAGALALLDLPYVPELRPHSGCPLGQLLVIRPGVTLRADFPGWPS